MSESTLTHRIPPQIMITLPFYVAADGDAGIDFGE